MRTYSFQPFAKCDTCEMVKMRLVLGSIQPQVLGISKMHQDYICLCRANLVARAKFARGHPGEVLFLNVDEMDQMKTSIPRPRSQSKASDRGIPLTTKLMGVIDYGHKWYGFWSFPEFAATANVTLTALSRVIHLAHVDRASRGQPFPRKLQLQMDNSGRDNKNHYLLGYCGLLVAEKIFEEVEVFFLPVGHTHNEIDATFSLVSRAMTAAGPLSLPDLMECANQAWRGTHADVGSAGKENILMNEVLDFRAILPYRQGAGSNREAPVMHQFQGLGSRRHEDEAAGVRVAKR